MPTAAGHTFMLASASDKGCCAFGLPVLPTRRLLSRVCRAHPVARVVRDTDMVQWIEVVSRIALPSGNTVWMVLTETWSLCWDDAD
mmetsp:Transcript_31572/g.53273  ORF Transcript_31572/g.53273 Transcript_31572/m.53273 type:complete len:86 (+) Transcript_31572:234-491(+)